MSIINGISNPNATTTSRGTKIVKNGGEMDKNAFLRILTAELSNQDPENAKDSTAYVTQMAQFASIEQMNNLNANLTMSAANTMIGKGVVLKSLDLNGNQIVGIVKAAYKQGNTVKVGVEVNNNGSIETNVYSYDDVSGVSVNPNDTEIVNSELINLLTEASLIGKRAEFNSKDASGKNYSGVIDSIVKTENGFSLRVKLDGTENETKDFLLFDLKSVSSAR